MAETRYSDYARYENGDASELALYVANTLKNLVSAKMDVDDILFEPSIHYAEILFSGTKVAFRAFGYSEAQIADLEPAAS